jgi:sulfide:quinone oxidoreductase
VARTLILGAGFGGIAVATELRRLLGDGHEIVLVDRNERFSMGLRKLWELVGYATIAEGSRPRHALEQSGIRFLQDEILSIDPSQRAAATSNETIDADFLVVALGCEARPDLIEGLADHGLDVWDVEGARAAAKALARFDGGRIAIVIAGVPYTCPPAPYECAMHVDEYLRERGIRDRGPLEVSTVQPLLMPNAGREGSAWLGEQLAARDITFQVGRKVERVEPGRVVFAEGTLDFELLLAVPPHRVPAVVHPSGLAGEGGWITVDRGTLETSFSHVFALGDVTLIPLANGLPLPKAGVIAELEGLRVAAAIAAEVQGGSQPPPFDGTGICFLEMGKSQAALVDGAFFAEPEPLVVLAEPSPVHAEEKRRFEAERLERWFGRSSP